MQISKMDTCRFVGRAKGEEWIVGITNTSNYELRKDGGRTYGEMVIGLDQICLQWACKLPVNKKRG